jgi:hypothetical protein
MKKLFLVFAMVCLIVTPALADWSITVTWTRSAGPDLASEKVLYSGAEKCSITATALTSCQFTVPALGGSVVVRSINSQGAFSDTAPVVVADQPAPASGVMVNVTYVAP